MDKGLFKKANKKNDKNSLSSICEEEDYEEDKNGNNRYKKKKSLLFFTFKIILLSFLIWFLMYGLEKFKNPEHKFNENSLQEKNSNKYENSAEKKININENKPLVFFIN